MAYRKNLFIIGGIVVAALLLLGAYFAVDNWQQLPQGASPYAVVYLSNGETYVGKLVWSDKEPQLSDVYLLEQTAGNKGQPSFNVVPLKNSSWDPIDEIYLNPSSILYWTYLQDNSQLVNALQNEHS